jgi:hypothetical protein
MPLRDAQQLLRHIPGYHSISSMRVRVVTEKTLSFQQISGRGDIWVYGPEVHELAGKYKTELTPILSEDQKLLRHYTESETNNYITATAAGLASTLAHAKHVYEEFRAAKNDPVILAIEAKKTLETRLAQSETRCKACDRTEQLAKEDDMRVVREITGGREMLEMNEENVLSEFQKFRCKECWYWRPHTPIVEMCKRILVTPATLDPATPDNPTLEASPKST